MQLDRFGNPLVASFARADKTHREGEGHGDVMLLDFRKRRGTDTIKEKEIKWRGGSLVVFCPPCGSMRAVIKDWLVVMWSCCHGGLYVSSRHEDQCCRPNEFCSVIYQKKAISFSYLTLPKNFPSLKK